MTAPAVSEFDLLAYVDCKLPQARRHQVEDHLARCPEDAHRVAADIALQEGLRLLFGLPAAHPLLAARRAVASMTELL